MIYDRIDKIHLYHGLGKGMDKAVEFIVVGHEFAAEADDRWRYVVGDKFFYKVTDMISISPPEREYEFEYHKRHVDVHLLLEGEETIAVSRLELLTPKPDFDEGNDFGFANGPCEGKVRLHPGYFLVCFPHDAHRPWLGDGQAFRKVLFKLACDWI